MKPIMLIPQIFAYKLSRRFGKPIIFPFNLTLSITSKCNSKCKTCNIWMKESNKSKEEELNLNDWKRILKSIGTSPQWITISGGEPFLREDLVEIIKLINKFNKPFILNIASNGILTDKIIKDIKIIKTFYKAQLIINLSIDGIKEKHDSIRGVKCFDKVLNTFKKLKEFKELKKIKNLTIGIHSVISRYNEYNFRKNHDFLRNLNPDSLIYEVAENRKELRNMNSNISPSNEKYLEIVNFLSKENKKAKGISRITKLLRKRYYNITKETITQNKAVIPCYAGIASAHINYNGDVWACCMKSEIIGNLRSNGFKDIWNSKKAKEIRNKIKKEKCYCTLANASYSNIICNF